MERTLSTAILDRLERQLRAVGVPAVEDARSGLPVEQIRGLLRGFPGAIPTEAELWWNWRIWGEGQILPDTQYLPLDGAMEEYVWRRTWAMEHGLSPQNPGLTIDDWWDPLWLPIFVVDSGMVLVIDVAASDGSTAPIHRIDWQGFDGAGFDLVMAPSLGSYVSDLLDSIEDGDYIYNVDHDFWMDASAA